MDASWSPRRELSNATFRVPSRRAVLFLLTFSSIPTSTERLVGTAHQKRRVDAHRRVGNHLPYPSIVKTRSRRICTRCKTLPRSGWPPCAHFCNSAIVLFSHLAEGWFVVLQFRCPKRTLFQGMLCLPCKLSGVFQSSDSFIYEAESSFPRGAICTPGRWGCGSGPPVEPVTASTKVRIPIPSRSSQLTLALQVLRVIRFWK